MSAGQNGKQFMVYIDLTLLATVYVGVGLLLIFLLWLYYDRRDRHRYESMRSPTTFVCVKCNRIYALPGSRKKSRCPGCGHENIPLRF